MFSRHGVIGITLVGLVGLAAVCVSPSPAVAGGLAVQQESNPFAPKPPKARPLPSMLDRDADGSVIWVEGDPARRALELLDLSESTRRAVDEIVAERDRQLREAAIVNADKIVRALQAWRDGAEVEYDAFGRYLMSSLGPIGRRGAIHVDQTVREVLSRSERGDLNAVVREYNLARVAEERERLMAEAADSGEELAEIMLRDSTILQRFMQRDVLADASRMLHQRFGGDAALAEAHPELEGTIQEDGYWAAMSKLTDAQLSAFVRARTGLEVHFPSPEGEEALVPLSATAGEQGVPQPENKPDHSGPGGEG
ncbi:MAG: hypothetical protein RIB58_09940 [Phycisphaerales bacterium]